MSLLPTALFSLLFCHKGDYHVYILTVPRDYRELLNTPAARYRTYMVIMMAFFGQWSGNNVVSYFMVRLDVLSSLWV